jgi:uncharacterized protein (DUF1778 family)
MRLPASDLAVIDQAAALRGRSRTDFMREAALREAELVLLDTIVPRMSPEAFAAFEAAISRPPVVSPRMLEVLTRRAPWERDDADRA